MVSAPVPCNDSFVVKLNPSGAVVFATYLSGNGDTTANAVAVDGEGNVYVAGTTFAFASANTFPVTPGAAFTTPTRNDGFIAKFNPSGTQLVYATFVPGAYIQVLALDPTGNAYVTGSGLPSAFPTTEGAFQVVPKASGNAFPGIVAKLNGSGSALVYATYLSGSGTPNGNDYPSSIAVDAAGNAFIAGATRSADFPVTPGAFLTSSPGTVSVFLTELNAQGSGLVFSTFLGESAAYSPAVKLDAQGNAFVSGATPSPNFPVTSGGFARGGDVVSGFLTRFRPDGSSLVYSTYLPSSSLVSPLDVDDAGNAVVAGTTTDPSLPVGPGAFQPQYGGGPADVYIAKFTPDGRLAASTYLDNGAAAIAFGPNGSVVVAGSSITSIFPSLTVMNSASYVASKIAPGELVSLLGYGIGPETGVSATGSALPSELGGVQVFIGGLPAPLLYVQSKVINTQVPWELSGLTSTTVRVSYPGIPPQEVPVLLAPSQPGVFGVRNSDGSLNSPVNPAKPGDFISVYGTGGGPTNPPAETGATWSPTRLFPLLSSDAFVTVGAKQADVLYAGASPGSSSGIFQINARLPSDLPASSSAPLILKIGVETSPAVRIAIGTR